MYKIFLSPSTQEKNVGVGNYGTEEIRMNQVVDVVESIVKSYGIIVFRNKPEYNVTDNVKFSNQNKVDLHVAIHSNATGEKVNNSSRGCLVFCHRKIGKGYTLAENVYRYVSKITPTDDLGIKEGFNYYGAGKHLYETAYTNCPACLVEVGFHDNKDDELWIVENIQLIGEAISYGILDTLGISIINNVIDENEYLKNLLIVCKKFGLDFDYWKDKKDIDKFFAIAVKKIASNI